MRLFVLAAALLFLLNWGAFARGESGIVPLPCPVGSPSPDGSSIGPAAAGHSSCTLTDYQGLRWRYNADVLALVYPRQFDIARYAEFQINSGGKAFARGGCQKLPGVSLWFQNFNDGFGPVLEPMHPRTSDVFVDVTRSVGRTTLNGLMTSGSIRNGDVISIEGISGVPILQTSSRIANSNLTMNFAAGVAIGCAVDLGTGIIVGQGSSSDGLTINGGEFAYAIDRSSGQYRGIYPATSHNWTLNGTYVHDNDMGFLSSDNNGTMTFDGVVFEHNGSYLCPSGCHNVYLGGHSDTTGYNAQTKNGAVFWCTNQGGYPFKSRAPAGLLTKSIFAGEDSIHTDCNASAAIDLACGGNYTVSYDVLELGPNAGNTTLVRYGDDENGSGANCTIGGWPSGNTLVIDHAILILDKPGSPTLVCFNTRACQLHPGWPVTIQDSTIVTNGTQNTAFSALCPGCVDGGGNTIYAGRAPFGLGTCSPGSCPLPAIP